MPWLIVSDKEALDLLDAAAEMAASALAARSRRVDQDNILRRSVDMSRRKLATLRSNIHQPPMITWPEVDDAERQKITALAQLLISSSDENEREYAFEQIRLHVLRPGKKEPFTGGSQPWADEDLSGHALAQPATDAADHAASVPQVRGKRRSRVAPSKASR